MGDTFQSKAFQRPIFNTTAPLTLSNIWTYIAARPLLLQATEQYGLHYIIRKGRQFSRKQNYYSSNRFVHRRLGALDYLQLLMLIIQWHCPASNINATYRGIRFDSTPDMSSGPGQASDNANRQTWHAYTPTASLLPSDRGSLVHVVFGLLAGWLACSWSTQRQHGRGYLSLHFLTLLCTRNQPNGDVISQNQINTKY